MIELNKLLLIVRRRAWLLALGVIVGLLAGYLVSSSQEPTYEASTKLLVSNELQGKNSEFAGLTNQQLVVTYVQLLKTKHLRETASEKAGIEISSSQVTVQQVPDTQIIEIRVEADNAEEVATIANTMALTLLEETEAVRTAQFSTSEASLTKQIEQVKKQITELQTEYDQAYKQIYQNQLLQVDEQIAAIQAELSTLQTEIVKLSYVRSIDGQAQVAEKEARVAQLQSSFKLYDELRANLIILGKPTQASKAEDDPQLQQMKSTIALYQKIYIDLLSTYESTRLARLQQTPNVLQIQEAFAPAKPVSPIPLEYTLISGIAGLILAAAVIFLLEILREGVSLPGAAVVVETRTLNQRKIN